MKSVLAALLLAIGFSGCSGPHYIIEGDRLIFYLESSDAEEVLFHYSIDEYQPHPARRNRNGTWEVSVPFGHEFRYFYVADGSVYLPDCRFREKDGFGAENCIFIPDL